jgi:hypothetical protein
MNAPNISRPWEPGLFARTPAQERYRVAGGGLTLISLGSGDTVQIWRVPGSKRGAFNRRCINAGSTLPRPRARLRYGMLIPPPVSAAASSPPHRY